MDLVSIVLVLCVQLSNFFVSIVLSDEELDAILDRSDMYNSAPMTHASQSAEHFKVLTNS